MDLGLKGRVAFVAGGTSGLGLAIGKALAAEGAAVALGGRRLEIAQSESAKFTKGCGVELDVRSSESIELALETTRTALGPIDIVILNSGGPPPGVATALTVDVARSDAELLLYGPMQLVTNCLPEMRSRGWGRILAVGSSGVQQPISGLTTSSMFRVALASYLKLLAEEVGADGVTVNMILPGRIATDRVAQLDSGRAERIGRSPEEVKEESEKLIPIGRYGQPEEFGTSAAFLCSDLARYITGEQLRIDGGLIRGL